MGCLHRLSCRKDSQGGLPETASLDEIENEQGPTMKDDVKDIIELIEEVQGKDGQRPSGTEGFPLAALPLTCQEYIKHVSRAFEVPYDIPAGAFLGFMSFVVCRAVARVVASAQWEEKLNLFVGLVGAGGTRKTAVTEYMKSDLIHTPSHYCVHTLNPKDALSDFTGKEHVLYCGDDHLSPQAPLSAVAVWYAVDR